MPDLTFTQPTYDAETEAKALVAAAKRVQTASGALTVNLTDCIVAIASAQERAEYVAIRNALTYIANQLTVLRGGG